MLSHLLLHECFQTVYNTCQLAVVGGCPFRPRNKQVALKPTEVVSVFVHGCYTVHACILVSKNSNTDVSRYATAKSYLVSLIDVTLILSLPTNIFIQSASINILFTFPFQVRLRVSN
jgi:hypothetical protein